MKRDLTHGHALLTKACERLRHASVAITRAQLATSRFESQARPYLNVATDALLASLRLLAGLEEILQDLRPPPPRPRKRKPVRKLKLKVER